MAADATAPTITLTSITGLTTQNNVTTSAGAKILLSSSEAVDIAALSNAARTITVNGTTLSTGSMTVTDMSGGGKSLYLLQYPLGATAPSATQTVEIDKATITDAAGLSPLVNPTAATAAADATFAASALATKCVGSVKTVIKATATFTAVSKGAGYNSYSVSIANQRGLVLPTITVDDTAKTISVVAGLSHGCRPDYCGSKRRNPGKRLGLLDYRWNCD